MPSTVMITGEKLKELRDLDAVLKAGKFLNDTIIIGVDLKSLGPSHWRVVKIGRTFFLGCQFKSDAIEHLLRQKGAILLPRFVGRTYNPYRTALYTPDELRTEFRPGKSLDEAIFDEFMKKGKFPPHVIEAVTRGNP